MSTAVDTIATNASRYVCLDAAYTHNPNVTRLNFKFVAFVSIHIALVFIRPRCKCASHDGRRFEMLALYLHSRWQHRPPNDSLLRRTH
eukprot:5991711-Amphidinium_carterae.1